MEWLTYCRERVLSLDLQIYIWFSEKSEIVSPANLCILRKLRMLVLHD